MSATFKRKIASETALKWQRVFWIALPILVVIAIRGGLHLLWLASGPDPTVTTDMQAAIVCQMNYFGIFLLIFASLLSFCLGVGRLTLAHYIPPSSCAEALRLCQAFPELDSFRQSVLDTSRPLTNGDLRSMQKWEHAVGVRNKKAADKAAFAKLYSIADNKDVLPC